MTLAEAIDTLRRGPVRLATAAPGHRATQAYVASQRQHDPALPFSFHEGVAVGMAHGGLPGRRTAVLPKAHGFLTAATAIADSVLDVEGAARELGFPVLRPEAGKRLPAMPRALRQSEQEGLPHLVRLNADAVSEEILGAKGLAPPTVGCERDVAQHVCRPLSA